MQLLYLISAAIDLALRPFKLLSIHLNLLDHLPQQGSTMHVEPTMPAKHVKHLLDVSTS